MEEIKVGEYVRLLEGIIIKVKEECLDDESYQEYLIDCEPIRLKDIVKHSFNIIDLIQVGDIIIYLSNYLGIEIKMEVNYVCDKENDYKWGEGYVGTVIDERIHIEDIKSIVTREEFENIEYKVGE